MINIGTRVKLVSGCVNPANVGKIGTIKDIFNEGDCETFDFAYLVVIEDGDDDDMSDSEVVFLSDFEEM